MAGEDVTIHVVLPVVFGVAVGLLEAYFVYEDESMGGLNGFFGKVWHGIIFSIVGVLIAANVPFIMAQGWLPEWITGFLYLDEMGNSLVVSGIIALVMFIKIDMAHRMKGVSGAGFVEKPWHKLIVALLIGFSPYILIHLYPMVSGLQEVVPWLPL